MLQGTGGNYGGLQPGEMLSSLFKVVPELSSFANLDLKIAFNKDSSRVGPTEWIQIAKLLHQNRAHYDAFMVVHGTDTMAYTASALSLMLRGFKKPIVVTGDPRSGAASSSFLIALARLRLGSARTKGALEEEVLRTLICHQHYLSCILVLMQFET